MGLRNIFSSSVDGIIADIVSKIEQLDDFAEVARNKATKKQQKVSEELKKIAALAHEGDRAIGIAGRLRQLVEG